MDAPRNQKAEQLALKTYSQIYKKMPTTSADWDNLHKLAYPKPGEMPAEFQKTIDESLSAGGQQMTATPSAQNVNIAANDLNKASALNNQLPASGSFEFGRILQNAIKTKTGEGQNNDLGTSKAFDAAGITGFSALNDSLSAHANEMQTSYDNYRDVIQNMTGTYKMASENALNSYSKALERYKYESDSLQKLTADAENRKQQLDLLARQHQNAIDLANLDAKIKNDNPSVTEQLSAEAAGQNIVGGKIVSKTAGQVSTSTGDVYDIGSYATDPNHERAVQSILNNMGQMKSVSEMDNYIKSKYPTSPVTGQMIANAAGKYGVSWEAMMAIMEQDSSMGTAGKAVRTKNPGNVGNTDSGATKGFGDWQAGVDAVAKNLAWRKVSTASIDDATTTKLEQELFAGKTAAERNKNRQTIKGLASQGKSVDEIRSDIMSGTYGNSSPDWQSAISNVVNNSTKSWTDSEKSDFKNTINRYIASGDIQSAKDALKAKVLSNMNETQATQMNGLETTSVALKEIRSDLQAFEKAGGKTNLFTGKIEDLSRKIGLVKDPEQRKIATKIGVILQQYRKQMTGVAFSPQEAAEYKNIFPSINNVGKLNSSLIDATLESFDTQLENTYRLKIGPTQYDKLFSGQSNSGTPISSGTAKTGNSFTITKE